MIVSMNISMNVSTIVRNNISVSEFRYERNYECKNAYI